MRFYDTASATIKDFVPVHPDQGLRPVDPAAGESGGSNQTQGIAPMSEDAARADAAAPDLGNAQARPARRRRSSGTWPSTRATRAATPAC